MALTLDEIKALEPEDKAYMRSVGDGLFIQVTPTGSKLWRFKYTFNGKSQLLALGKFPDVGLKQAEKLRTKAKAKVLDGINPAAERKKNRVQEKQEREVSENTLEKVALEWLEDNKAPWTEDYTLQVTRRLQKDVFPYLGKIPVADIEPPALLKCLKKVQDRGAIKTARFVHQIVRRVFSYAVASGYCQRNPAPDIVDALAKHQEKNLPAILEEPGIKGLLLAIGDYRGNPATRLALQFLAYTFQRPGEVRGAEWAEFDFEKALWEIPSGRMKMRRAHLVPLSRQALAVLEEIRPLTGHSRYVFPSEMNVNRCISANTKNAALKRMGYTKDEMCPHGFRTIASTKLHESNLFDSRVIEVAMAHVDKNKIRGVYNRAMYLDERRKLMQWYGDYLDSLRSAGKVIPFGKAANG